MSHADFAALNAASGGGGQADLRQSAQRRRRLAAPARSGDHREPAAALLRLCLGRDQRAVRRDAVRRDGRRCKRFGLPTNPLTQLCNSAEELLAHYRAIEAERASLGYDIDGVVYKVDRPRLAGPARLRLALAALGDRAQIPGRAGDDRARGHRHPGRPHRRADAGRAAEAGHGRRRRRVRTRRCTTRTRSRARTCAIGDTVLVQRAGDVIPQIVEVVLDRAAGGRRAL